MGAWVLISRRNSQVDFIRAGIFQQRNKLPITELRRPLPPGQRRAPIVAVLKSKSIIAEPIVVQIPGF
jgi:hypothetical protein